MRRYATEAPLLGKDAVSAAVDATDIGLFAVVSCTGYSTPGLDIQLAADLGMPADVQRLMIGHMGCYAAIPGLGTAADLPSDRAAPEEIRVLDIAARTDHAGADHLRWDIIDSGFRMGLSSEVPEVRSRRGRY